MEAGLASPGKTRAQARRVKDWLKPGSVVSRYRPHLLDWRFWVVQFMVISIAVAHDVIEANNLLSHFQTLYFLPVSLFFVPVMYAAVTFGFAGSFATALWAVLITIPNWVFWHSGMARWGSIYQMSILVLLALLVGLQVDRVTKARRRAQLAGDALKRSEKKYRGLFESSPVAVLVLDPRGAVLDANPAASVLLGKSHADLVQSTLSEEIGEANVERLLVRSTRDAERIEPLVVRRKDGKEFCLEPIRTGMADLDEGRSTQVVLRDVTEERQRQAGLKAFAAHIVGAQEEERRRIARELHDGTIQNLILLCRKLDSPEGSGGGASAAEDLVGARQIAEGVVKELRGFAKSLRPAVLDDLGLVTSIRRIVTDWSERTGVAAEMKLMGQERRLTPDAEIGLFRIAEEALRNVERHSAATEARVDLDLSGAEVKLSVRDNGIGFAVPPVLGTLSASGRLGLLGIQERAQLLGGRLDIISAPGSSATLVVRIPASGQARPSAQAPGPSPKA